MKPGDLPDYHKLDEYTFQDLCCAILGTEPEVTTCEVFGTRGQKQYGADVVAHRVDAHVEVGQCKRYRIFTPQDIAGACDEFLAHWQSYWASRQVHRFILFVTCALDDRKHHEEIEEQIKRFQDLGVLFEVWSSRQITAKLRPHRGIVSTYLAPAGYWVDYICGPLTPIPSLQNHVSVAIPEMLVTQFETLSQRITSEVESKLAQMRHAWRSGRRDEVRRWIDVTRADLTVWAVLPREVKAGVLRLAASLELSGTGDLGRATELVDQADKLAQATDSVRLRAYITYRTHGAATALAYLGQERDVDCLNLKAAMLLELGRVEECAETLDVIDSTCPPNGETCRLRALVFLAERDMTKARLQIQQALALQKDWRIVRDTTAVLDYLSALSPAVVPTRPPLCPSPLPLGLVRRDDESLMRLRNAAVTFKELLDGQSEQGEELDRLQTWYLACLAGDPERQREANEYAADALALNPGNPYVIAWAIDRNLAVDLGPSITALEEDFGQGASPLPGTIALVSAYLHKGKPERALEVLSEAHDSFLRHEEGELWTFWRCQALIVAGDTAEASGLVGELKNQRLVTAIRTQLLRVAGGHGNITKEYVDYLHATWMETQSVETLYELCEAKAELGEWAFVFEHRQHLIQEFGTIHVLWLAALAAHEEKRSDITLSLLDSHRDLFTNSRLPTRFRRLKIAAQKIMGVTPQVISEAEELAREEPTLQNLRMLAQVYLEVGDLSGVCLVARKIEARADASPEECLRLAQLVRWDDSKLAVSLWRKAIARDDLPDEMVTTAIMLGFSFDVDDGMSALMGRMVQLAERGEGGVSRVNLREAAKFIGERRQSTTKVIESYTSGALPVHLTVDTLGVSLADLYHRTIGETERLLCEYGRPALLCRHGGRPLHTDIGHAPEDWRLHLDTTSFLLAAHLGILRRVEETFRPIRVPTDLVGALVAIRARTTPTQLSRVKAYRTIAQLIGRSRLRVLKPEDLPQADSDGSDGNLSANWLRLFAHSKAVDGYLVDFLPLRRADLSELPPEVPDGTEDHVVNCRGLIESLRSHGPLSENEYANALEALNSEGVKASSRTVPLQGRALILHGNIAEVLAEAEVLSTICDRFQVYVELDETLRVEVGLQEYERQQEAADWIGELLESLRRGISSGTYETLPVAPKGARDTADEDINEPDGPELACLYQLLTFDPSPHDVLWVDDRALTGYPYRDGAVPIVGITEVLKALLDLGRMSHSEYYGTLSRLRAGNVRYIPLDSNELVHHLNQARVEDGKVVETRELVVLRRYVAGCLLDGSSIQRPETGANGVGEMDFLLSLGRELADALNLLWKSAESDPLGCRARSNWLLEHLFLDHAALSAVASLSMADSLYMTGLSIAGLVSAGMTLMTKDQQNPFVIRRQYFSWLHHRLIRHRFDATPLLAKTVAQLLVRMLDTELVDEEGDGGDEALAESARKYAIRRFVEDLPEPIRAELQKDDDFLDRIGIKMTSIVSVGDIPFARDQFVRAVSQAINGQTTEANPLHGKIKGPIAFQGEPGSSCEFSISAPGLPSRTVHSDVFEVLRYTPSERESCLRKHREWFDCPADRFPRLCAEIASMQDPVRRLDEVERWISSGVARYMQRLRQLFMNRRPVSPKDLRLPSAVTLVGYLGLAGELDPEDTLRQPLSTACETLLSQEGPESVFRRLSCLPIPLPDALAQCFAHLPAETQRQLIKGLLKDGSTPLARLHLLRIVVELKGDTYRRLARRIVRTVTGDRWGALCKAFQSVLRWTELEAQWWTATSSLSPSLRLAAIWTGAELIMRSLVACGVTLEWIVEAFEEWSAPLCLDAMWRRSNYWSDVSHPRLVNADLLTLTGLAYALDGTTSELLSTAVLEHLQGMAFHVEGTICMPTVDLLTEPLQGTDSLGSFLGGDRGRTLESIFGRDISRLLSSDALSQMVRLAVRTAKSEPADTVAWGLINTILAGSKPDAVDPEVIDLIRAVDLPSLYSTDRQAARLALLTATLHAGGGADTHLVQRLEEQLLRVAEISSVIFKVPVLPAEGEESQVTAISLLQGAANLSLLREAPETVKAFSKTTLELMRVWPLSRHYYRPILEVICQRLSISDASPMWHVLVLSRTA